MRFLRATTQPRVGERGFLEVGGLLRGRALAAAAILSLGIGAALRESMVTERSAVAPASHEQLRGNLGLSMLPLAAQGVVSATLGASIPSYRVSPLAAEFLAQNPAQNFDLRFATTGVRITAGQTQVGLSLSALGYGRSLHALGAVTPNAKSNRVVYTRPEISEWYQNGPLGLEQGFTLARAPAGDQTGSLTAAVALSGNARVSRAADRQGAMFEHPGGPSLLYGGLLATDAHGRTLHSWVEVSAARLLLHVDTHGARFPVRIDPLVQEGPRLTGSGEAGRGQFGTSVALSSDGRTALVGAPGDAESAGAAWVFVRAGATWRQQGSKLTPTDESGAGQFASSVALSADGSTALIGAPADASYAGAAWVFSRSGTVWSQQGPKLTGSVAGTTGSMGSSVGLSADGNTALISAAQSELSAGALVFIRTAASWSLEATLTNDSPGSGGSVSGIGAALSADGNTALVGANYNNLAGGVWVFIRSGSSWTRQAGPLTGGGEVGPGEFGISALALSADGSTALVGGANDNGGAGAAWVFARAGSVWSQDGAKLSGVPGSLGFGSSVSLAGDGRTALIGAPESLAGSAIAVGSAWRFRRSGTKWIREGAALSGGSSAGLGFGTSLSLSSDGLTALVGGTSRSAVGTGLGAAWVYVSKVPNLKARAKAIAKCNRLSNKARRRKCIATAKRRYPI